MRCEFDPAARRLLLCSVKFAPLRNDKIYGAIWRCGGVCSAAHLFYGSGFGVADKNLNCECSQIAGGRLNLKRGSD